MSFENIKIANSKPNLSKFKNFYMPLSANLKNKYEFKFNTPAWPVCI
jgi:hypothetical protein